MVVRKQYLKLRLKVKDPANGTPSQNYTCHMGSHSVTCHPTQVNIEHTLP